MVPLQERQANRERRLSLLPPEPEEGCGQSIKVMLRSGDGSKLERRFKTSDRLQVGGSQPCTLTLHV